MLLTHIVPIYTMLTVSLNFIVHRQKPGRLPGAATYLKKKKKNYTENIPFKCGACKMSGLVETRIQQMSKNS